jgi:hypothetical protein
MNIALAIRRLNRRYDNWSRGFVERMITRVDHSNKTSADRPVGIRDLFTKALKVGQKRP